MTIQPLVVEITEPSPGTLGDRIRRVEELQAPEYGTLGYRLSLVGAAPGPEVGRRASDFEIASVA